ncbi:MAG TPA: polysaccharide deacetylase, partial [Pseudomonadota bacterium]|nr:polysaccharide deacetylase [Pseudomonadota bacterium]
PPYYLLKLSVLGLLALRGQQSASIVGSPWQQLAPTQPYRPSPHNPNRSGDAKIVELPVAVTPALRLPAIGTFLLLSKPLRRVLLRGMTRQPFFNLELHGIDLIDAKLDGIPAELVAKQPDLQLPLWQKMAALGEILRFLQDHAAVVPLSDAAQQLG